MSQSESSLAGAEAKNIKAINDFTTSKLNYENVIGKIDNIDDLNMIKEFTELNSKKFFIHPVEGHIAIFPSRLSHGTECIKTDFNGERLSIVGDVNLILKEEYLLHSMGLIDEKYWKKYE